MTILLPAFVASLLLASVWTILLFRMRKENRRFMGLIGAWTATLILGALWQAEAIPWLWLFPQGVVAVWLTAFVLLIVAAVYNGRQKEPVRRPVFFCAAFSVLVNLVAGLQVLWVATVSPGGV